MKLGDLKRSKWKFACGLGLRGHVFFLCILNYTKAIYNIGTEILYFQCFLTTDMFLFSKSIIPEDSKISRRDLEHVCVKRRFKAILKKVKFSTQYEHYRLNIILLIKPMKYQHFGSQNDVKNLKNLKVSFLGTNITFDTWDPNLCDMNKRSITLPSLKNQ